MFKWYWPTTGLIYVWRRGFGRWVVRRGVVWDELVLQAVAVEDEYDTYCIGQRLGLYVGSLADRRSRRRRLCERPGAPHSVGLARSATVTLGGP